MEILPFWYFWVCLSPLLSGISDTTLPNSKTILDTRYGKMANQKVTRQMKKGSEVEVWEMSPGANREPKVGWVAQQGWDNRMWR